VTSTLGIGAGVNAITTTAWRTFRTPPNMGPSSTWRVLGAFRVAGRAPRRAAPVLLARRGRRSAAAVLRAGPACRRRPANRAARRPEPGFGNAYFSLSAQGRDLASGDEDAGPEVRGPRPPLSLEVAARPESIGNGIRTTVRSTRKGTVRLRAANLHARDHVPPRGKRDVVPWRSRHH
jgi:hypothetical protein